MLPIDYLYRGALRHPDAPALIGPRRTLGYRALAVEVDALAAAFQAIDPNPQSRVGICAEITEAHVLALLATMAAGKVWVPLNPRDGREDLDAKIAATRPSIVIADAVVRDRFTAPAEARLLIGATEDASLATDTVAALIRAGEGMRPREPVVHLDQTQAIKFTGGTSGRPKGVLQPYRAWLAGAVSCVHAMGLTAADRYLFATPITHAASCYITPILAVGGALVLPDGPPKAAGIIDALAEGRASMTFAPPTLLYALTAAAGARELAFPRLRHLIYGGAPMPPERIRDAQAVFGPVLCTSYGQTEAPQMIAIAVGSDMADEANLASVGRPTLLTRVAAMSPDGVLLPPGEDGEIVVRGDLVMSGYLDNPEATAETLRDGWLHTGDIGLVDDRGYLFLKDRLRDVIITGGFNVYPTDVEAVLARHPAVAECCVFGTPDPKWGECVTAAVKLKPGARATPDEIIAWSKEIQGSVKTPKSIHVLPDLPHNPVGKVLRREVRDLLGGT